MTEIPYSSERLKQITNGAEQGMPAPFHHERYANESI